jgi:Ca2+-binding RTX toxin-like protein
LGRLSFLVVVTLSALVVAGGVALAVTKNGGPGDDVLRGTEEPDLLDGRAGNDRIFGYGGDDSSPNELRGFLIGGKGDDVIHGGSGDDDMVGSGLFSAFFERGEDVLYGGEGDDLMNGGQGADVIYGSGGNDLLIDGARKREGAKDKLFGGLGADRLDVDNRPAAKDIVHCGGDVDLVDADRKDVLFGCENRGTVGD